MQQQLEDAKKEAQVCQCKVGLFFSLLGLFCLYIRSLLTLQHMQQLLEDAKKEAHEAQVKRPSVEAKET
jgi:hypothetical protein